MPLHLQQILGVSPYNGADTCKNSSPDRGELQTIPEQADNTRRIPEDR